MNNLALRKAMLSAMNIDMINHRFYHNNNSYGIYVSGGSNNTVTGNTCLRGTGTTSDYTSSQYTIKISGKNSLVANNNCMGKAPVDSGTGNTLVNNKYE